LNLGISTARFPPEHMHPSAVGGRALIEQKVHR
jgi:hypothetical protein